MLFNSLSFALFMPIVFILYWVLDKHVRWQNRLLLVASYVFYGWWDWRYLFLIAGCSLVNFLAGRQIFELRGRVARRLWLIFACVVSLGVLGVFKYFDFFIVSFAQLFTCIGIHWSPWVLNLALPVGISFFTFQALSYTIDIYLGKLKPTNDWVEFFTFISFFPQLVAGPIERASNLLPQFQNIRKFDFDKATHGVCLIAFGLFKKMVVADTLSQYVDKTWGDPMFYIFFLDSDDSITPDCIEIMAKLANKYPQAAYVQGNTVTKGESLMSHQYKCTAPEYCDNKEELEELILSKTLTTAWNKLLKRSFIIDHSLYFPTGIVIEDTYWSYFLAKYSYAVAFTNERTYYYFKNNNSIINAKSKSMNDKRIQGLFSGFNAIFEDMKKEKKASKQQRVYLASNIVICMSRISSFSQWLTFWKLTTRMFNTARKQITRYQFLLYISTMPPLCFLSKWNGWTWRLNQKLSCHV